MCEYTDYYKVLSGIIIKLPISPWAMSSIINREHHQKK